ncbi:hypothetical protein CROQUDRAFT_42706 [Cronartium quercuum f. sp. fusiforme G11]|uniref:Uncharacterized protein n=1 Tax=Cronartium quercuum f. sp. fusiforme G11 TaxID=708437 RepID=A0A9P6NID5_9BASI|nr:hypothetical protein CROQUDRAFT_42706 [Cronartium quercuum f. sp. fusiforme G11]
MPTKKFNRNGEKKSRSANWTSIEGQHLAVSYITVGEEPKWANDQSGLEFWKKVPSVSYLLRDLCSWGNKICPATLKFSSFYAKISCNLGSGTSLTDWLCQAKALYSSEKDGQDFKHVSLPGK